MERWRFSNNRRVGQSLWVFAVRPGPKKVGDKMISLEFINKLREIIPERFHPFFYSLSHVVYIFCYKQPRIENLNYDQYWDCLYNYSQR